MKKKKENLRNSESLSVRMKKKKRFWHLVTAFSLSRRSRDLPGKEYNTIGMKY